MALVRLAPGHQPRDVPYEVEGRMEEARLAADSPVDLPAAVAAGLIEQGVAEAVSVTKTKGKVSDGDR